MIKKYALLPFFVLFLGICYGQKPRQVVDSLKRELRNDPKDEQKVAIYSDLAWYYSKLSTDSALQYGNKALELSKALKEPKTTAQVYSDLASVYMTRGNLTLAKNYYVESLIIRTKIRDFEGIASNWSNLGGVFQKQNVPDSAMIYYLKALHYYESQANDKSIDFLKNSIAALHEDMHNYPKAIALYKEVAEYRERYSQGRPLALTYNSLGNVYNKAKDYVQAESYFKQAIDVGNTIEDSLVLGKTYNNLGMLYNSMNQSDKAIPFLEKSQQIFWRFNSNFDRALVQYNLAKAYTNKKEYAKAKNLYLKSIHAMLPLKANDYIETMYLNLIPIYANLNRPDSAAFYTEKYKKFQDKTVADKVALQTQELETRYQKERKQRLSLEKQADSRQLTTLIVLLILFAIFAGVIGYILYHHQTLKNQQLAKENKLKLGVSKTAARNKLQDQRLSISRDLHENINSQLTFILSAVDNIKYAFDIQNLTLNSKLDRISNFTKATIIELRDTIWAMDSDEIAIDDLRTRITGFVEKAQSADESAKFEFTVDPGLDRLRLNAIIGMNVYRTIQESVGNAIKYAKANHIDVAIKDKGDKIEITISDDGKGFYMQVATNGNGLQNMKKRINDIGGTFDVDSEIGKGTVITALINKSYIASAKR